MASVSPSIETTLQLRRTFQAPREKVFRAWTDPVQMNHWCAPSADYDTTADVDLRVGGKYRIEMKHKDGASHTAFGEYQEISEPEKLVYTWSWEDGSMSETLVTVEFGDLGSATELVLTHERFPTAEWRDKHSQGWSGCLGRLEERLAECPPPCVDRSVYAARLGARATTRHEDSVLRPTRSYPTPFRTRALPRYNGAESILAADPSNKLIAGLSRQGWSADPWLSIF